MLLAAVAASLVWDRPAVAALFATASACEAWWYGLPMVTGLLGAAVICALITVRG
jgi:hypothetical protein